MFTTRHLATLAALGGILQLALGIAAYQVDAATVLPSLNSPPTVQATHLAAHPADTLFWTMLAVETAGLILFLAFATYLAARLTAAGAPAWLAATTRTTAITAAAVKLASLAPALVAIQHPHAYGATTAAALLQINSYGDQVMLALQGTFFLTVAAAAAAARTPRWLAPLAFASGIATVAAAFGWDSGQLGAIAITLAVAVWLLRSKPTTVPTPAAAQPALR